MVAYSFQARFVAPIWVCLGIPVKPTPAGLEIDASREILPKRHTIRADGKRRHARPGEMLQLYCAQRSPMCFKIADAPCAAVQPIIIWPDAMAVMLAGKIQTARQIQRLARDDGFWDAEDMRNFFLREHGKEKFSGSLIWWEAP